MAMAFSLPNLAEGVYIITSEGIAYHQHEVLHIIKPQEDARWRVMICKGGVPPLMIYAALRASMICQACGLDKKIRCLRIGFFGRGRRTRTHDPWFWRPVLYQLSYTPT